jgi:hypothetical protein
MIILLVMANSLAARENSRRGPKGPPDGAARGVYVGDKGIWRLGKERRRFSGLTKRDCYAENRPRRRLRGRKVMVLPSGHRHPVNKACIGYVAIHAAPQGADVTIQDAPPASIRQVNWLPSARNRPARTLAGRI